MARFQLINDDGEKQGVYIGTTPSIIAKKIAKQVYIASGSDRIEKFNITFCKNQVKDEGGDKLYKYKCVVKKLREPIYKYIGDSKIQVLYDVSVKSA